MNTTINTLENILEVKSLDNNIPSCSRYKENLMGYILYAKEDKIIFPFVKNKVKLNVERIELPYNTIGIITCESSKKNIILNNFANNLSIDIYSKQLPYKIKKGDKVGMLYIIPTIECHVIKT